MQIQDYKPHQDVVMVHLPLNGDVVTQRLYFGGGRPRTLKSASFVWAVAGTDGGGLTADLTKDASGVAPGGGTVIDSAAVDLTGTINVPVDIALKNNNTGLLDFYSGDSLSLKMTGVPTSVAGVAIRLAFYTLAGQVAFQP